MIAKAGSACPRPEEQCSCETNHVNNCRLKTKKNNRIWGCGSVGRAMRSQCMGQGFESPHLHQNLETDLVSVFSFACEGGFAQLCCAQLRCMNPCRVRAGAYSLVQAHSFHYYGINAYESPHLHHKDLQNRIHGIVPILRFLLLLGVLLPFRWMGFLFSLKLWVIVKAMVFVNIILYKQ